MYYIIGFFIVVFIFAVFVLFRYRKWWKKIDKIVKDKYIKKIRYIKSNISAKERIIDFDKFYHMFLKEISYEGSFWEILKKNPSEIWDIDKIWELHKLRNKLVHDFDEHTKSFLIKKAWEYEKEANKLLNYYK